MIVLEIGDWRSLGLRGVAAIVFGALALVWPGLTLYALVLLFGAYALVDGVAILAAALGGAPGARQRRGVLLFEGIVSIGAGAVTFAWPAITAVALLYLIAAWALVTGVLEIAAAVRLRREIRNEWLLGLFGVLSVVLAVVLVIRPAAGALGITWAIGWYALISGVVLLMLALRIRQLTHGPAGQRLGMPQAH